MNSLNPLDFSLSLSLRQEIPDEVRGVVAWFENRKRFIQNASRVVERLPSWIAFGSLSKLRNCIAPQLVAAVDDWIESFVNDGDAIASMRSLLFLGPTGVGKTTACGYLINRLVNETLTRNDDRTVVPHIDFDWVRATDLAGARRHHALGKGEAPLVERCADAGLLILDDLGWETTGDTAIAEVLNRRYECGECFTLVTSGYPRDALLERYGEAVLRRLLEVGGKRGRVVDLFPREAA
jgi:adenylate kinase family enzyme